jgi:AmmeMemoRadiSam system protein B
MNVRRAAVAGLFYPQEPAILQTQVKGYLEQAPVAVGPPPRALIAPHAGYIYSGPVAGSAYRQLAALDHTRPYTVFLLGPSHRVAFHGVSVCAFDAYETPLGRIPVSPLAHTLAQQLGFLPKADLQEHSLEVHLPFLQMSLPAFELVPMVIGNASPWALAKVLAPFAHDPYNLFVVSTDLSHYHPYDEARAIDATANQAIPALDIQRMATEGDACGLIGVLALMDVARTAGWQGTLLDYRNSGDTVGPRDQVVGYGAYRFGA